MRKAIVVALPAIAVALLAVAPAAFAATGDKDSAARAVERVYNQVQAGCTPTTPPSFQSISWNNFYPSMYGAGVINDATAGLGGEFMVSWRITLGAPPPGWRRVGNWDVQLQFC